MSNKTARQKGVLPKLRFPAFRDAPGWEIQELSKLATFVKDRISLDSISKSSYISTENMLPDYNGIKLSSSIANISYATHFLKDDILISNIRPYLKKIWISEFEGGSSNDVVVVRVKDKLCDSFLGFQLKNDFFISYVMKGAKGVKMPRGDISLMKKYPVSYPTRPEQQKIADCLSSIDELIAAEGQRLEALREHKKGLMQQLFPAAGETLPKLRFPAFRDAPGWEVKKFEEIYSFKRTNSYSREMLDLEKGTIKNIHYGDIHKKYPSHFNIEKEHVPYVIESSLIEKINQDEYCREGDLIFADASEDIEDVGKCIEVILLNNEKIISGLHTILARQKTERLVIGFSGYLFHSYVIRDQIRKESQGAKVLGISRGRLAGIDVCFPKGKKEQQKIADCLSSIDELIAAEGQRLKALREHKKGLMQQLFPAAGEVAG